MVMRGFVIEIIHWHKLSTYVLTHIQSNAHISDTPICIHQTDIHLLVHIHIYRSRSSKSQCQRLTYHLKCLIT